MSSWDSAKLVEAQQRASEASTPDELREAVIEARKAGATWASLSRATGVDRKKLRARYRDVAPRKKPKKCARAAEASTTDEQEEALIAARESAASPTRLAKAVDVDSDDLMAYSRDVAPRKEQRKYAQARRASTPEEMEKAVIEARKAGATWAGLAEATGIDREDLIASYRDAAPKLVPAKPSAPECMIAGCGNKVQRRSNWHRMSEETALEADDYHHRCRACYLGWVMGAACQSIWRSLAGG